MDRTNKIRNAFTGTKGKGFPFLFVSASKEFAFEGIRMTPLWQYTLQRRKCIGVLPTWIMYVYMLAIFQLFFLYARVWNEAGSCLCWHSVYRKTRPLWSRWSIWFWVVSHGLMAIAFGIGRCKSYCSSYLPKSVGYLKTELIEGYQADLPSCPSGKGFNEQ